MSALSIGYVNPPSRDPPSPFIPRYNSLAFHPREMVYAVGSLDNTGKPLAFLPVSMVAMLTTVLAVRLMGCKLKS